MPKKLIVLIFFLFANCIALNIFFELPEVEKLINKSFLLAKASKFLLNKLSNPISFPQAVIVEVSCAKAITGYGFLLTLGLNLTKNSAARCWASAADPPFPQI